MRKSGAAWRNIAAAVLLPVIFALVLTLMFPVYFHWDDVDYLHWARRHPNPLAVFHPSSTLFGTFRPMLLLTWWTQFRLFHLESPYYQFILSFLYGSSFVLFYMFLRRLYNARAALMSLAGYVVVFFPLGYIIFWYSDLSFVQELFWIQASLVLLHLALVDRGKRYLWGLPCYLMAFLSKEPSIIIVTSTLVLITWARWKELPDWARRRMTWLLPVIGLSGMIWLLVSPAPSSRQGILDTQSLSDALAYAVERWHFYAGHLMAHGGFLLWASVFFLLGTSLLGKRRLNGASGSSRPLNGGLALLLLVVSVAVSFLLRREPGAALVVLLVAGIATSLLRREVAPGMAWGFLLLLALMGVNGHVRTYLVESSFGFAIVLGLAGDEIARSLPLIRRVQASRALKIAGAATAVALMAFAVSSGPAKSKLRALEIVSANRQNFREITEYLVAHPPSPDTRIAVVNYSDMDLGYRRGILAMPDEQKGGLQKTIEPHAIPLWLDLNGVPGIEVYITMKDYFEDPADSCYLWIMNNHEKKYVDGLGLEMDLLFETRRRGEGAWLYRLR